ncbi:Spo0B domain-containing protein [Paenibacillus fonticola]|uniref:Spo0B domain-containing protein n=1 Tax=Paenibacillus fonticola TaxID=379896 RepID=UPI00035CBE9B|nr:Spo0B domain-containing protein [Paenibacillus fonticola]
MKHRFTVPVIAGTLMFAMLVILYFVESTVWYVVLCVCLLAVLWGYVKYVKEQAANERKQLLESVQRTATATLGHHRHDWMNDLQILYGYIQLGKVDKLVSCVDRIKERMAVESKISRLGIPALVFYLQSFREVNCSVQLAVDIEGDVELGKLLSAEDAEQLTEVIVATIRAFQFAGRSSWGEMLQLKLSFCLEENEVLIRFDQDGTACNVKMLLERVNEIVSGKQVRAEQVDPQMSSVRLRMLCGNL